MKFDCEVEINLPISRVVELFDNPDNLKLWQPELTGFEHLSGTPGQPGAKSLLKYQLGKKEVKMIETITVRNLPDEFSCNYDQKGSYIEVNNYFIPLEGNKTLYKTTNLFVSTGYMKFMEIFMPWLFKKETMKYLVYFKKFAEKQG